MFQYLDYVLKVMLPESLIHVAMCVYGTGREEAEGRITTTLG